MEFWDYYSNYDDYKRVRRDPRYKIPPADRNMDPTAFYAKTLWRRGFKMGSKTPVSGDNLMDLTEHEWYKSQRPHYRIFPPYVEIFARTNLKIPTRYLAVPYPAFVIQFPKQHEPRLPDGRPVHALLVMQRDQPAVAGGQTYPQSLTIVAMLPATQLDLDTVPNFEAKLGERFHRHCTIPLPNDDTLLDDFLAGAAARLGRKDEDGFVTAMTSGTLIRILLSVMFLATGGDRLIEPHILNDDFQKYLDAVNGKNQARVQELHEKATKRRNEGTGFTVGRAVYKERLLGQRFDYQTQTVDSTDRELTYQHQRAGHMHLYWTGPNRDIPLMRFIPQLTVRADLPPAPVPETSGIGYRTLKEPVP